MTQRIQRKRTKGWRMPTNTVSVTRPGKWGNPFRVGMSTADLPFVVAKRMRGDLGPALTQAQAVEAFEIYLVHHIDGQALAEAAKRELRNKHLACFCAIGTPCHGDSLLRVANPVECVTPDRKEAG